MTTNKITQYFPATPDFFADNRKLESIAKLSDQSKAELYAQLKNLKLEDNGVEATKLLGKAIKADEKASEKQAQAEYKAMQKVCRVIAAKAKLNEAIEKDALASTIKVREVTFNNAKVLGRGGATVQEYKDALVEADEYFSDLGDLF